MINTIYIMRVQFFLFFLEFLIKKKSNNNTSTIKLTYLIISLTILFSILLIYEVKNIYMLYITIC